MDILVDIINCCSNRFKKLGLKMFLGSITVFDFFRQSISFSAVLLIITSIILPSGHIFDFNIKMVFVGIFSFCSLLYFSFFDVKISSRKNFFLWGGFVFLFLIFFSIVAYLNDIPLIESLSHAKAILAFVCLIFIPCFCISNTIFSFNFLLKVILVSVFIHATLKLILALSFCWGWSLDNIITHIRHIFHYELIWLNTDYFYRVHAPIDFLYPICIYLVSINFNTKSFMENGIAALFLLMLFLGIIVSYSRLLYFYSFITVFLIFFRFNTSLSKKLLFCSFFILLMVLIISIPAVNQFLTMRYFGLPAKASDSGRWEMLPALLDTFRHYPFFGRGLGSSAIGLDPHYRGPTAPVWYFELQWLSFLAQFGIIGLGLIFYLALIPIKNFILNLNFKKSFFVVVIYFLWLFIGFFNNFILCSSGGIISMFFVALALYKDQINFRI